MKKAALSFCSLCLLGLSLSCYANGLDSSVRYFGQTAPGTLAIPFMPEHGSSSDWELGGQFSANLNEFYLVRKNYVPHEPSVIVYRKDGRDWQRHDFHRALSGDLDVLYSKKNYIEKTSSGWSLMKSLGPQFDREDWGIMRLSASANGTFVFDDWKNNDVIRISKVVKGKREAPKLLGTEINSGTWTAHPFIAHDESYIIWDSEREGGYGASDIYISFLQEDGRYGTAINLGAEINTPLTENGAFVTPDGKFLFFGRSEEKFRADGSSYWVGGKHWVDAQVIEKIRKKK